MLLEESGEGEIFDGVKRLSTVYYRLFVDHVNEQTTGSINIMSGEKGYFLYACKNPLTLHLDDGRQVPVVVESSTGALTDTWSVVASGPIQQI
jgi:hypothetical protein